MSEARKCDRCHGFYEIENEQQDRKTSYEFKGDYINLSLWVARNGVRRDKESRWYDLCPNCMLVLDKWLENPDIDNADCVDRSNGATEKENGLGYTMTKEEIELDPKLNEYGCHHDKCCDCSHFSKEPNPFNVYDHNGIYKCNDKNVYISGNCSRPNVSDMTPKDFCDLGCNFVKETIGETEYKDPCKSCNISDPCEQCDYGYCSEEEKKKRWLENHKEEAKLSDPYEDGGL